MGLLCIGHRQDRGMSWFLLGMAALAWCVVPLPLAVAVGRSFRQSSPEYLPPLLVEALRR